MLWQNPNVQAGKEHFIPSELAQPEQIAEIILFLISDKASFISGSVVNVDGGRLAELG